VKERPARGFSEIRRNVKRSICVGTGSIERKKEGEERKERRLGTEATEKKNPRIFRKKKKVRRGRERPKRKDYEVVFRKGLPSLKKERSR